MLVLLEAKNFLQDKSLARVARLFSLESMREGIGWGFYAKGDIEYAEMSCGG